MNINDAAKAVLAKHKDSHATYGYDLGTFFVISIKPNNWNDDDILLDPFFAVDKRNGLISEWSPLMDMPGFKKAKETAIKFS